MSTTIPFTGASPRYSDFPSFKPFYIPEGVLAIGAFGGSFLFPANLRVLPIMQLVAELDPSLYMNEEPNPNINFFGVQALKRNRNISREAKRYHPYGWFEWYLKFSLGQRGVADEARVNQWRLEIEDIFYYIRNGEYTGGGDRFTDLAAFPLQRQQLLHYAWDPTIDPRTIL